MVGKTTSKTPAADEGLHYYIMMRFDEQYRLNIIHVPLINYLLFLNYILDLIRVQRLRNYICLVYTLCLMDCSCSVSCCVY